MQKLSVPMRHIRSERARDICAGLGGRRRGVSPDGTRISPHWTGPRTRTGTRPQYATFTPLPFAAVPGVSALPTTTGLSVTTPSILQPSVLRPTLPSVNPTTVPSLSSPSPASVSSRGCYSAKSPDDEISATPPFGVPRRSPTDVPFDSNPMKLGSLPWAPKVLS